jgi:hypothetical protein
VPTYIPRRAPIRGGPGSRRPVPGAGLNSPKRCRVAAETFAKVHDAVVAKRRDRLAGHRVDFLQVIVHAEDQTSILAILAFPIVQAARRHGLHAFADPELFSGACIKRDEGTVSAASVYSAVHDDRMKHRLAVRVRPGDLQLLYVLPRDVFRIEIARTVGVAAVRNPGFLTAALRLQRRLNFKS